MFFGADRWQDETSLEAPLVAVGKDDSGNRPRDKDCPSLSPNHHREAREPAWSGCCMMTSYKRL